MIASLKGTLLHRSLDSIILDVGGVGYQVGVSSRTYAQLPAPGGPVQLYTHQHVREDVLALYGFSTMEELMFFRLLLSVKGIGPRAGLAILGRAELRTIKRAILQEDAALLTTVPGIGAKTAARVVLELRGKLTAEMLGEERRVAEPSGSEVVAQALAILTGLGYTPVEAKEAVGQAVRGDGGGRSVQELVTEALRNLDRVSPA